MRVCGSIPGEVCVCVCVCVCVLETERDLIESAAASIEVTVCADLQRHVQTGYKIV